MCDVVEACKRPGCRRGAEFGQGLVGRDAETGGGRLVFFDNIRAYGRVEGAMTEETPFNPCSRKGEVRANITTTLQRDPADCVNEPSENLKREPYPRSNGRLPEVSGRSW